MPSAAVPTLMVVNPASGGGRTAQRWPVFEAALRQAGVPLTVHVTAGLGDAISATREAIAVEGISRVVAVGGDGTFNEVVNGCFAAIAGPPAPRCTVGLIPSGTGVDFARSLGLPHAPAAVAALLSSGATRVIDAGRVSLADGTVRHFANEASFGIGAAVVARVERRPRHGEWRGRIGTFLVASLGALLHYRNREIELVLDGEIIRERAQQVVVANGRSYGAGMRIAPHALPDDGRFDVVVVGDLSIAASIRAIPRLYRGTHVGHPLVRLLRARLVSVVPAAGAEPLLVEADGELLGRAPAEITLLPSALRVAAPG